MVFLTWSIWQSEHSDWTWVKSAILVQLLDSLLETVSLATDHLLVVLCHFEWMAALTVYLVLLYHFQRITLVLDQTCLFIEILNLEFFQVPLDQVILRCCLWPNTVLGACHAFQYWRLLGPCRVVCWWWQRLVGGWLPDDGQDLHLTALEALIQVAHTGHAECQS